jgi:hypothetical protein
MFAEIVPEQLRSAVYAFDRSFEGAVGATAAPLVGENFALIPPSLVNSTQTLVPSGSFSVLKHSGRLAACALCNAGVGDIKVFPSL